MENVSDALKMAFAVLVFIIALSIVFSLIGQIKETADAVLFYSDKTNYYSYSDGMGLDKDGRVVGVDTVIATLKNYRTQSAYVKIDGDEYNYSSDMDSKVNEFIKNNINSGDKYLESTKEITTGGEYRIAEDGTKLTITPGNTRTYIIYKKII